MKRYEAIEQRAGEVSVARLCAMLNVSESGYYAWKKRPPSQREQENASLKAQIHGIWQQFRQCYGAPRIHAELQAQGCSDTHLSVCTAGILIRQHERGGKSGQELYGL